MSAPRVAEAVPTDVREGIGVLRAAVIAGLGPSSAGSEQPAGLIAVLGRSPLQRHLHHLAKLGIERCVVLYDGPGLETVDEQCQRQRAELRAAPLVSVRPSAAVEEIDSLLGRTGEVLLVKGNAVFDPRLYEAARDASGPVEILDAALGGENEAEGAKTPLRIGLAKLASDALAERGAEAVLEFAHAIGESGTDLRDAGIRGLPVERRNGARPLLVDSLPSYLPDLRRRLRPYWLTVRSSRDRAWAGELILDAAQKGVLDFPARYFHPLFENPLTRILSGTSFTPNQVTLLTALLGFAATYLFATGRYGWALALAIAVNILDGVDGKLARIKLLASRFGDRLDHVLDVAFEFSWYLALGWRLSQEGGGAAPLEAAVGLMLIMVGCRTASGVYRTITGRQIHDHTKFDAAFRLVAGRRNIYMVVLLVGFLIARLEAALYVCFWWAAATLGVYVVRILIALAGRRFPMAGRHPG